MMDDATQAPVDILVVEDDEIDVEMLRRALAKTGMPHVIHHAETGIAALDMLRGENNRPKIPPPRVMLVDINMPLMNGLEMLRELRKADDLKRNIAFILTTSPRPEDKAAAYGLNVAGYFLKQDLGHLIDALAPYCRGNQFPDCPQNVPETRRT